MRVLSDANNWKINWHYFWLWSVAHGRSELTKCYRVEAIAAVLIIILAKGHGGSTDWRWTNAAVAGAKIIYLLPNSKLDLRTDGDLMMAPTDYFQRKYNNF